MKMTNSEALEILKKKSACRDEMEFCALKCRTCEHYVNYDDETNAINVAIEAVEFCVMVEDDGK